MQYIIPDGIYQLLKWAVLIVLPALATMFSAVAAAWGMDATIAQAIVTTVTAVSAFGGAILGVSSVTAKPTGGEDA